MKFLLNSFVAAALMMGGIAVADHHEAVPGNKAPDFTLPDQHGNHHTLSDFEGKVVILEWLNHGCPFVVKHYRSGNMQQLQKRYTDQDVVWLSIISSAPGKQGYMTAEEIIAFNEANDVAATAVLLDPEGTVGRAYGAQRTPEMFIINDEGVIVYHGAIDSERGPGLDTIERAENYVVRAMQQLKAGEPVEPALTRPYGCTVKYPTN